MIVDHSLKHFISAETYSEKKPIEHVSYSENFKVWSDKFGEHGRIHKIACSLGLTSGEKIVLSNIDSLLVPKCTQPTHFDDTIKKWMLVTSVSDDNNIKKLLDSHEDLINSRDPIWGMSALHWAIKNDNFPLIVYLCENGADINLKTHCGETPLHYAIKFYRKNIVEYLTSFSNLDISTFNIYGHDCITCSDDTTAQYMDTDSSFIYNRAKKLLDSNLKNEKTNKLKLVPSFNDSSNVSSNFSLNLSEIYSMGLTDQIKSETSTNYFNSSSFHHLHLLSADHSPSKSSNIRVGDQSSNQKFSSFQKHKKSSKKLNLSKFKKKIYNSFKKI